MTDKFLGGSNSNLSNGTANLYIANLSIDNLTPSLPVKTDPAKTLISAKLDISDTNNLQNELNNKISNPLTSSLNFNTYSGSNINNFIFEKAGSKPAPPIGQLSLYANNSGEFHQVDENGIDSVVGGEIFDQSLNTNDDVAFNSIETDTITPTIGSRVNITNLSTDGYIGINNFGGLRWANTPSQSITDVPTGTIRMLATNKFTMSSIDGTFIDKLTTPLINIENGLSVVKWIIDNNEADTDALSIKNATNTEVIKISQDINNVKLKTNILEIGKETVGPLTYIHLNGRSNSEMYVGNYSNVIETSNAGIYMYSSDTSQLGLQSDGDNSMYFDRGPSTTGVPYRIQHSASDNYLNFVADYSTINATTPLSIRPTQVEITSLKIGTSPTDYILPSSRGTNNQILKTNGSGVVSWQNDVGTETLQDVYNNSVAPQITTTGALGAVIIQKGIGASNDVFRINDDTGLFKIRLQSSGDISCSDIIHEQKWTVGNDTLDTYKIKNASANDILILPQDASLTELKTNQLFIGKTSNIGGNTTIRLIPNGGNCGLELGKGTNHADTPYSAFYSHSNVFSTISMSSNGFNQLLFNTGQIGTGKLWRVLHSANDTFLQFDYDSAGTPTIPFLLRPTQVEISTLKIGTSPTDYTLPSTRGTNNQILKTNGSGIVSWQNDTSGFNQTLNTTDNVIFNQATLSSKILNANGNAAAPTYSFTSTPNSGVYQTGLNSVGISSNGNRIVEVASDKMIVDDGYAIHLNSTSSLSVANPVVIKLSGVAGIVPGNLLKIINVGGVARVTPTLATDTDEVNIIGTALNSVGVAGGDCEVAIGGTYFCMVGNGQTITVGGPVEKSDVSNGRCQETPVSPGTFGTALTSGTGNVAGTVFVLVINKINEGF